MGSTPVGRTQIFSELSRLCQHFSSRNFNSLSQKHGVFRLKLQIGVLRDSSAFQDAVNLAANITSKNPCFETSSSPLCTLS